MEKQSERIDGIKARIEELTAAVTVSDETSGSYTRENYRRRAELKELSNTLDALGKSLRVLGV